MFDLAVEGVTIENVTAINEPGYSVLEITPVLRFKGGHFEYIENPSANQGYRYRDIRGVLQSKFTGLEK